VLDHGQLHVQVLRKLKHFETHWLRLRSVHLPDHFSKISSTITLQSTLSLAVISLDLMSAGFALLAAPGQSICGGPYQQNKFRLWKLLFFLFLKITKKIQSNFS
jgi:hypothetical protein